MRYTAYNGIRIFISANFTYPHILCFANPFLSFNFLDPYIRKFASDFTHILTMDIVYWFDQFDPRPIIHSTTSGSLFLAFGSTSSRCRVYSQPTLPVLITSADISSSSISIIQMLPGVSGEAFQGVTPSFHL